jgi:hypothetical protein
MKFLRIISVLLLTLILIIAHRRDVSAENDPPAGADLIFLRAADAELKTAGSLKLESGSGAGNIGWWTSREDEIGWRLLVPRDGEYSLLARVSCETRFSGSAVKVAVGRRTFDFVMPDTGQWYYYRIIDLGDLSLKAGTYPVTVKAASVRDQFVGNLAWLCLFDRSVAVTGHKSAERAAAILKNRFIWIMYDAIYSQEEANKALAFAPEVLLRGWFKWGKPADWKTLSWLPKTVQAKGCLFGGGGTLSALFPYELTEEAFRRMADRNPHNDPEYFYHKPETNYYHGDIQKREYLDYILRWIYNQIDTGVDTLFLDEVNGAPSQYTGYSDNGVVEFTRYLKGKYAAGKGWSLVDDRWRTRFDIDLHQDTTDRTIDTFDFRLYLKRKGWLDNPIQSDYPLRSEWGNVWDYLLTDTYINQRNQTAWRYIVSAVRDYCDKKGRSVLVAANGLNEMVDYQIEGVWYRWKVDDGKLDLSPSYMGSYRSAIQMSRILLGRDVPLVVFHDWGFGMPFYTEIGDADRILWLRVFASEVFAAGAVFVWPVCNCGNKYRPTVVVEKTMRNLIAWYSANRNLYQGARWVGETAVDLKGAAGIESAVTDLQPSSGAWRVVHLINKKLDRGRQLELRRNFSIGVPSPQKPHAVFVVSPDFSGRKPLRFDYQNGSAQILVDRLDAYTVIVLEYQ